MKQSISKMRFNIMLMGLTFLMGVIFALSFMQSTLKVQAQTAPVALITLNNDHLAGLNLGEFVPYEPDTGDLFARGDETYYSKDGSFGVGIWESKPGSQTYTELPYDELMFVLDGHVIMTDTDGNSQTFGPGEGLILPKGYSGTLTVPEGGARKIWSSYMGGQKG